MIKAKINGSSSVKIMAGIKVATLSRYENQLNRPMRYAVKDAINAIFAEDRNDINNTGIGANQTRYQKSPFKPVLTNHKAPEKRIPAMMSHGDVWGVLSFLLSVMILQWK
jgi:hypothetical protein